MPREKGPTYKWVDPDTLPGGWRSLFEKLPLNEYYCWKIYSRITRPFRMKLLVFKKRRFHSRRPLPPQVGLLVLDAPVRCVFSHSAHGQKRTKSKNMPFHGGGRKHFEVPKLLLLGPKCLPLEPARARGTSSEAYFSLIWSCCCCQISMISIF